MPSMCGGADTPLHSVLREKTVISAQQVGISIEPPVPTSAHAKPFIFRQADRVLMGA